MTIIVCIRISLIKLSRMAEMSNEDVTGKGEELWKALKKNPLDRQTIRVLLQNGASPNFREPGIAQVILYVYFATQLIALHEPKRARVLLYKVVNFVTYSSVCEETLK